MHQRKIASLLVTGMLFGLLSGLAVTAPLAASAAPADRTTYVKVAKAKKGKAVSPRLHVAKRVIVSRGQTTKIPMRGGILSFRQVKGGYLVEMNGVKNNGFERLYYLRRNGSAKLIIGKLWGTTLGADYHIMSGGGPRTLVALNAGANQEVRVVRIRDAKVLAARNWKSYRPPVKAFHAGRVWLEWPDAIGSWDFTGNRFGSRNFHNGEVDLPAGVGLGYTHDNLVVIYPLSGSAGWREWNVRRGERFAGFSANGRLVAFATSGGDDGYRDTVRMRDATTGRLIRQFTTRHTGQANQNFGAQMTWQGNSLLVSAFKNLGPKVALVRLFPDGRVRRVSALGDDFQLPVIEASGRHRVYL